MDAADVFLSRATRPLIVCDIDGVLAHLSETIATALNARFGLSILAHEMTTYRVEDTLPRDQGAWLGAQFNKGVFYANAAPVTEAITALGKIRHAGYRVVVSSDRPPATTQLTTRQWLDRNRVQRDDTVLIGHGGKQRALAACGPDVPGVLVDDNPSHWKLARPGVEVWTPRMPYTPATWQDYPGVWVFDDWAQVLNRLSIGVPA